MWGINYAMFGGGLENKNRKRSGRIGIKMQHNMEELRSRREDIIG